MKLADIGDVLTATPALRAVRRAFPDAHITALIAPHCRELLEGSPSIDELLLFSKGQFYSPTGVVSTRGMWYLARLGMRLRRGRYDTLVLLHHLTTPWGTAKYAALSLASGASVRAGLDNGRGWFLTHRAPDEGFGARHEVEYCNDVVQQLGATPDFGPLDFPVGPEDIEYARAALAPATDKLLIAMHPGSGAFSLARRWPADRFVKVGRSLALELGATIVLVGGREEETLNSGIAAALGPAALNLTGRTSLRQLGAVMQACDLFLGNDSGVMHIAAAVGTSVAAIFGPSNHRAWGPWTAAGGGPRSLVLRAELPCSPCFYTGHGLGTPEGCPNRTCLQLIQPKQVVQAIERLLHSHTTVALPTGRTGSSPDA